MLKQVFEAHDCKDKEDVALVLVAACTSQLDGRCSDLAKAIAQEAIVFGKILDRYKTNPILKTYPRKHTTAIGLLEALAVEEWALAHDKLMAAVRVDVQNHTTKKKHTPKAERDYYEELLLRKRKRKAKQDILNPPKTQTRLVFT